MTPCSQVVQAEAHLLANGLVALLLPGQHAGIIAPELGKIFGGIFTAHLDAGNAGEEATHPPLHIAAELAVDTRAAHALLIQKGVGVGNGHLGLEGPAAMGQDRLPQGSQMRRDGFTGIFRIRRNI